MQTRERRLFTFDHDAGPPHPPGPRSSSAWQAFVAIAVCLGLWAVLAAPILQRDADAGPVGARRSAALALLEPLVAFSDLLLISRMSGEIERALGRELEDQAGGELVIPPIALPEETFGPETGPPRPTVGAEPTSGGTDPPKAAEEDPGAEDPVVEPGQAGLREPKPTSKLRVAVIGDSLSQGLGPAIAEMMNADLVRVLPLGRQSTGLARQDYFNWQAGMRQIVEEFRPDLVFVMLGSNDAQAQIAPGGAALPVGSIEWVDSYRDRTDHLIREATAAGTRVVWVGIPVVSERQRWDFYRRVNAIYAQTASADPLGTFVDSWSILEARDGGYTAFVRNEHGVLQEMRAPDGIHLTPTGYAYLARQAIRAAARSFGLSPEAANFRI